MSRPKEKNTSSMLLPYAFGTFGLQSIIGFTENFQVEFYNKAFAVIDGQIITRCAIILASAKLISCILDPFTGMFIDRSARHGKSLLSWLRNSIVPLALFTVLLFWRLPFERYGGKLLMYAFIAILSLLWNVTMSCTEISLQSMISFISKTDSEGSHLVSLTNFAKNLGLGAPPILVTLIMFVTDSIRGDGATSDMEYYLINVLSVIALGLCLTFPLLARDTGLQKNAFVESESTVSIHQMIAVIKNNKNALIVFFINILGFARNLSSVISLQATGALIGKIKLFGTTMDTTVNATWIPFVFGAITTVISLVAVPAINRRLREKRTYLFFSVVFFIFSVAAYSFYLFQPEGSALRSGNGAMKMIMVMSGIGSFFMGANEFIPLAMTASIAESEAKKGTNGNPSVLYAVLTMSFKLGAAASVILGLYLVGKSGYNQLVYEANAVTVEMQNGIMFAFMLIPGISALLSAIPALFYDLNSFQTVKQ